MVTEYVKNLFPDCRISLLKKHKFYHSDVFVLKLVNSKNGLQRIILLKHGKSYTEQDIQNEVENQILFSKTTNDPKINAPKILSFDVKRKIIVMEYVRAVNLKQVLLKKHLLARLNLEEVMRLVALALVQYHKSFAKSPNISLKLDSPLLRKDICVNYKTYVEKLLSCCTLQKKVQSFIDFSVWNILIGDGGERIFLVDFPERVCIGPPHLDIGRFKFSLRVIKQYPQFRILKREWWKMEDLYEVFLRNYCYEMKTHLDNNDFLLIDFFEKEYARKLEEIYTKKKCDNIKFLLERIYMMHFINQFCI